MALMLLILKKIIKKRVLVMKMVVLKDIENLEKILLAECLRQSHGMNPFAMRSVFRVTMYYFSKINELCKQQEKVYANNPSHAKYLEKRIAFYETLFNMALEKGYKHLEQRMCTRT